ncbi:MAG: cation-translocating P-type ATPase, partial [Minisyncoccales bacterium]
STKEIVPGDILVLRTGEKIPADCLILSHKDLLVNEAVLTGESEEQKKSSVKNPKNPKNENLLFAGSFITNGKCIAKVMHTGMNTKFGKIAGMISTSEKELPLQQKVNTISKYMAIIGVTMAILTGISVIFQSEISNELMIEILILVIAISVSAFPEGFPVVLITTLSIGASRMAKKNAIINRMSIIETLGETTVICSDKTGTITKGEMTAKKVFLNNDVIDITGVGYEGTGEFFIGKKKITPEKNKTLSLLLKTAVLCNDSRIKRTGEDNVFSLIGTPTEGSLLVMSAKENIFREDFNSKRIDEIPFSSERKMMSVVCKEGNKNIVYSKGALGYVLDKCKYIQKENGVFRILERDKKRILSENKKMTSYGLRTLALCYKESSSNKIEEIEKDLIFIGIVGIEDPPREGIKEALEICKKAGIQIKMITGDDKETALAIGKQIGLSSGKILEGYEIDELTDSELQNRVRDIIIFARVKPEHKLRIVKSLKAKGEIVTMTGDGVNDAPALKEAQIGVAMGKNGTDVSRSVADMTLKDDNFVTIVEAIREGRTIFKNIRKFVTYQISVNYAELMILFLGAILVPFFGWPIPLLLALHILFMNIITDNLPAITLGVNNSSGDIMNDKPRRETQILNKNFFIVLIISGSIMAILTLGTFYFAFNILEQSVKDARTTALITLIMLEIGGAFNFRSFRKTTLNRSPLVNPYLALASAGSLLATILVVYTPLNRFFETMPVPFIDWLIAIVITLFFILVIDILKGINNRKKLLELEH